MKLLLVTILIPFLAVGAESGTFTNTVAQRTLPQGPGLAAAFKADSGIETHSAVIFADDFERGELGARWDDQSSAK
jgi:hypothetical protein